MRSGNVRSVSFTFHKNPAEDKVENELPGRGSSRAGSARRCLQPSSRQKLQDRFDEECPYSLNRPSTGTGREKKNSRSSLRNWSDFNLSLPNVQPRRMLRSGADKISKTFSNMRNSIDTLSQRFRNSTRRRYRLENESPQAVTPRTRSRCMLGRTPTKLYSPFGIETPQCQPGPLRGKENMSSGGKFTPRRSSRQRSSPYTPARWTEDHSSSGRELVRTHH